MHPAEPPRNAIARPTAGRRAVAAVVGANAALAFGPWFVRLADTGPVAAAFWRMALAVPVLLLAAAWRDRAGLAQGMRFVPLLGIAGLVFALDLGSWHIGIRGTTLANATLFGNCAVLIFPIWGFAVARAWPTRMQAAALALACAGAALLMGRSAELSSANLAGDLFALFAGVCYAGYFILMTRARTALAPLPALALSSMASIVPLLLFAMWLGEAIWPGDWAPLLGLALVSQVVGQGLMIYALGQLSPLVVGIALLIQPMISATIGWFAYGERLGPLDFAGAAMVAVALVLVRAGRSA